MYSKVVEDINHVKLDHEETEDLDQSYNEDEHHDSNMPEFIQKPATVHEVRINMYVFNLENQQGKRIRFRKAAKD